MDITTLKSSLNILDVTTALDISIDAKTKRAICPFHDDKTPSLQFSAEKQISLALAPIAMQVPWM